MPGQDVPDCLSLLLCSGELLGEVLHRVAEEAGLGCQNSRHRSDDISRHLSVFSKITIVSRIISSASHPTLPLPITKCNFKP